MREHENNQPQPGREAAVRIQELTDAINYHNNRY